MMRNGMKRKHHKKWKIANKWRFVVVYLSLFATCTGVIAKFAQLQLFENDYLSAKSDQNTLRKQIVELPRGMITDREGRVLAVSVPVEAIWVDPKVIADKGGIAANREKWQTLATQLNLPLKALAEKIDANKTSRFLYLARQVQPETADNIRKLNISGIHYDKEFRRYYPSGETAAHLIGFTDIDGKGIEGIENSFDSWLQSQYGQNTVRRDRQGRLVERISSDDGKQAESLTLSIDERLQTILYNELSKAVTQNKAESGSAVLVDIRTGEILAMANSPAYNPNNRTTITQKLIRNRAITDTFEPGSTVKPLVIMAALQKGIVDENAIIDATPFFIKKHEIKDVGRYSKLSLEGILQKSSNVGVSRLALKMETNDLVDIYSRFGFGKSTNIGLVGEVSGNIGTKSRRWSDLERATYSFGYGLTSTPLQLAKVYATIGAMGVSRPLSIVKVDKPVKGEVVFPADITRKVVHLMESVALPGGGGTKAAVKGFRVAIKTGTAKKVGPAGKYVEKYIAYTAGIAPVSDPRFALVVVIDEPKAGQYYGGMVSAPVFSQIMGNVLRTMNVRPDALPDNSIVVINR